MAGTLERKHGWPPTLPDLFSWVESGLPGWRTAPGLHGIRIEEEITEGKYVLSAELPGIDPDKDLEITVSGDLLTLRAERAEETEGKHHSEFRYGTFARAIQLPTGARGDEATADYQNGVLTVEVPLAEPAQGAKTVPVRHG